jgi:hypothetical protein
MSLARAIHPPMNPSSVLVAIGLCTLLTFAVGWTTGWFGRRQSGLAGRTFTLLIALSATTALSLITARFALSDPTAKRLRSKLSTIENCDPVIYEKVGLAFCKPDGWELDDAAWRLGGGEVNLIKTYDQVAASISQGIALRVRTVQQNYAGNPEKAIQNQLDVDRGHDPRATAEPTTLAGLPATRFRYTQSTGQRTGHIQRIWVSLSNRARLEVIVFSNLEPEARLPFQEAAEQFLRTIKLDTAKLHELSI